MAPLGAVTVRQSAVVPPPETSSTKKADVIDLTLESSSEEDDDEDDDEDSDPPLKKRCLYMSKAEEMHSKGFVFIHLIQIRPGISVYLFYKPCPFVTIF